MYRTRMTDRIASEMKISKLASHLDEIAGELEQSGNPQMALAIDQISDKLEGRYGALDFSGMGQALKELHKFVDDVEKDWKASKNEADEALVQQHAQKINKSIENLKKELWGPGK